MVSDNSSNSGSASTGASFRSRSNAGMLLTLVVAAGAMILSQSHVNSRTSHLPLVLLSTWMSRKDNSHGGSRLELVRRRQRAREKLQLTEQEYQIVEEQDSELSVELLTELLVNRTSSNRSCNAAAKEEKLLQRVEKFQVGDVVEQMYNGNTVKNRILYPFQVEEVHFGPLDASDNSGYDDANVRYTLTRLFDGTKTKDVPESFLQDYSPYPQNSKALCNVGGYGAGTEKLVSCTTVDYIPASESLVTKESKYRVRTKDGEVKELSIGRLNRFADHLPRLRKYS
mmetsp:Transcript_23174/g.48882  ORF Transcript_23174/g.48882 Transcript_23174/m.48882 type:complete len:284 (+) Transcript_23174:183-1034(+)